MASGSLFRLSTAGRSCQASLETALRTTPYVTVNTKLISEYVNKKRSWLVMTEAATEADGKLVTSHASH